MAYTVAQDAPKAEWLVVSVHSEYERSIEAFISEKLAREFAETQAKMVIEVYLTKIVEIYNG